MDSMFLQHLVQSQIMASSSRFVKKEGILVGCCKLLPLGTAALFQAGPEVGSLYLPAGA